jgi:hypothetical protein
MSTENELSEYRTLCAFLISSNEKFLEKKQNIRLLLEKTARRRLEALMLIAKANRLTRHLTRHQRQVSGIGYHLGEIKIRLKQAAAPAFQPGAEEGEISFAPESGIESLSRLELKQRLLLLISLIDELKKKLLKLELLEMRCREFLLSIIKALEAFRHEWKIIRRRIYPFGIFSLLRRSVRSFFGSNYFYPRDMESISALVVITGLLLQIADSTFKGA